MVDQTGCEHGQQNQIQCLVASTLVGQSNGVDGPYEVDEMDGLDVPNGVDRLDEMD